MIDLAPREQLALSVLTFAVTNDDDTYNLRHARIAEICQDFIRNYNDLAQAKRWTVHAESLRRYARAMSPTTFRGMDIVAALNDMAAAMESYVASKRITA